MSSHADVFWGLLDPWRLLYYSFCYLPLTIISLLQSGDFGTIFSWDRFQSVWFAKFWAWAGPRIRERGEAVVLPLLEGRVRDGQVFEKPVMPPVSGVVIEIGPGTGMWASIFSKVEISGAASSSGVAEPKGDGVSKRGRANDVTKVRFPCRSLSSSRIH